MNTTSAIPFVSWREGRRHRAWELAQAGWKQCQIATALGVTPAAVSQWLQRARMQGVGGLRAQPAPGRRPRLSPAHLQQLRELLQQGAEACGFRGAIWTRRRVAQVIRDHFGVSYHPTHVGRLLRQLGWTVQKPIVRATQRDEATIADWSARRWPALKKKPRRRAGSSSG